MVDLRNVEYSGTIQAWYDPPAFESDVIKPEKFKIDVDMREATAQDQIRHANQVMSNDWYPTLCKRKKVWTNDPVVRGLKTDDQEVVARRSE
jgi:hypothetical protein